LVIAWKWEGLGGFITMVCLIAFHVIGLNLIFYAWIDGLAAPGLLFLISWVLSIRQKKSKTIHQQP